MGPTVDGNDDDDMIMIIVGDVDANDNNQDVKPIPPMPITIKEEAIKKECDESKWDPDSILQTAELHGQYITFKKEDQRLKEEYIEYDYLEDSKKVNKDESSSKEKEETSDAQNNAHPSYINQLRKNFPKMRKDDENIVAHLTEIMKQTKPPVPPNNFYTSVDNKLVCVFCDAESPTLPIASRHYQINHGPRYLICYACGDDFKCTASLYKHEKRCRVPGAELVLRARGRYLGRKGRTRPFLTKHKFEPWGENYKDHPNKRNKAHEKQIEKPKKKKKKSQEKQKDQPKKRVFCAECPASFRKRDALRAHERMHRGERPFQCDRCPLAYTSAVALRRHLEKHANAEYICDVCGISCNIKTTLIVHMNTHLPQPKFPCDRCERRFTQKHALRYHINRDHLNLPPPLACPACPKRFPRVANLNLHMKTKHGLTVMTRKMFLKALPSMKDTELKKATVVFNQNSNDNIFAVSKNKTDPITKGFNKKNTKKETEPDEECFKRFNKKNTKKEFSITNFPEILDVSDGYVKKNIKKETEPDEEYSITNFPEILDVSDGYAKEVIVNTTNYVVDKTPLNSCELEFASFIANRDKSPETNMLYNMIPRVDLSLAKTKQNRPNLLRSRKQTPKVDVNVAKMHEKIKVTCGRNMPDVIADNSKEMNTEEIEVNVDPLDLEVTNVKKDNILRNKNLPVMITRGKAASQASVEKKEVKTVAQKKRRVKNKRDAK